MKNLRAVQKNLFLRFNTLKRTKLCQPQSKSNTSGNRESFILSKLASLSKQQRNPRVTLIEEGVHLGKEGENMNLESCFT
jgi:hypothetical protein